MLAFPASSIRSQQKRENTAGYGGRGNLGGRGMGRGGATPMMDYEGNGRSSYAAEGSYQSGRGAGGGSGRANRPEHDFVEGKLFIGGLDTTTTEDNLVEYCRQWGELADYVLMEGRGFGFVTFKEPAGAQAFLEHREHIINDKRVEAKAAVPRNSSNGGTMTKKMFVGGTGEIKDEDFRAYFQQFGDIDDCVVLRKPDGGSRGFGFVTYKDEISVEKCLVMQHELNGRTVELKRAIKKEEMGGGGGANSYQDGGSYGQGGSGGPVRTGKQPDWVCPSADCRNKNFGWREVCNRCQQARPTHPELAPARGAGGGFGGRQMVTAGVGGPGGGGYEAMGMGAMGLGAMGMGSMGMAGYGMTPIAYGMAPGMGMGGGMAMGGYGATPAYGGGGTGYGRSSGGRGGSGGGQGRYRPY